MTEIFERLNNGNFEYKGELGKGKVYGNFWQDLNLLKFKEILLLKF